MITRVYNTADLETPRTQLLSNGTYNVMITTAGPVIPGVDANAVTRWREDVTRDNWGTFIYLRDVRSGAVWSAGHQPVSTRPQSYEVAFSEDKADSGAPTPESSRTWKSSFPPKTTPRCDVSR